MKKCAWGLNLLPIWKVQMESLRYGGYPFDLLKFWVCSKA